jgi:endonuclease/exonuclease/phosphatase (EEP) superfamily protein YafD
VRVLTSRNLCPALQRSLADWNPDLIASSDGGSNQILVRHPGRVLEHRRLTLAWRPEQRRMHWARLELPRFGRVCVANLHASAGRPVRAGLEVVAAAQAAVDWSDADSLVLGGDFNLRPQHDPGPFEILRERFGLGEPTAPDTIDHLLVRGLAVREPPRRLAPQRRELIEPDGLRVRLSDHRPVSASFVP